MVPSLESPVIVDFPLHGERWVAVTTPATRVPSHGTDRLGLRYAYDLLQVDTRGAIHPSRSAPLVGGRTRDYYGWNAPIHAPFDGVVVSVADGMPERDHVRPVRETVRRFANAATFTPDRIGSIMGNAVILRAGTVYAGFAHLAPGSIEVRPGQPVSAGDVIGHLGHTGNSTSPHLHFQLMDSADLTVARGIPCAFRTFEIERDGGWERVTNRVPDRRDRIRFAP